MLVPKLVTTLKGYTRRQFLADTTAGAIVGIVALPLAIAFAIGSGVPPQAGLYTAIIAGFLISALGGSKVQIGGPTGAFVVIVYGVVQRYGVEGLTIATIMAGVILVVMGLARLGGAIKFIPQPVVTGFTSGIAVIIASGQVRDFLGLQMGKVPAEFVQRIEALAGSIESASPWAAAIAVLTVLIVVYWPRVTTRVPSPAVALVVTTLVAQLAHLPVESIGSRFGTIDASFPALHFPSVTVQLLRELVAPAFTIAMLGGIESLLSAVVADGMIGSRHRSNMELVGQGVANIVTPMFGGIPATGAIARTATNIRSGGRTPVAGIVHALTLLAITLFFGRWASLIPMATLAGILMVVAYHMSEWRTFRSTLAAPRSDIAVLLVTFGLTVLVDLTVALGVGMVLASFLFMRKMAAVTQVNAVTELFAEDGEDGGDVPRPQIPRGVVVYEIDGPFFFGAAATFKETMGTLAAPPKALLLGMSKVDLLDATGLSLIKELAHKGFTGGTRLVLYGVHSQPRRVMENAGLLEELGADNCVETIEQALERAEIYAQRKTPPGVKVQGAGR
ncbi:MAG: STAS domain-containing protein [Gemmatimonadetes bacterium]|nr:STAS domain-containing protein [Gemmatimonadota bacterium]